MPAHQQAHTDQTLGSHLSPAPAAPDPAAPWPLLDNVGQQGTAEASLLGTSGFLLEARSAHPRGPDPSEDGGWYPQPEQPVDEELYRFVHGARPLRCLKRCATLFKAKTLQKDTDI